MDLRLRFGLEKADYTERTCIIVVEIARETGNIMVGSVVDTVSEVLNIKPEEIEETPVFGTEIKTDYIMGMAKTEGGVKILLDIDKVLTDAEIGVLAKVG